MSKYDTLNDKQKEACFYTDGPLLLLAGAGSGKTRVLTHRVAYIIENGLAKPWEIMAITFTNKASKEMAERVDALIGSGSNVFISTFHSACVRFLRRDIDKLGFTKSFIIYDNIDSKKLIKDIVKRNNLDPKMYKESSILSEINNAKNKMISPDEYYRLSATNFQKRKTAEIYQEYQKELKKNNALDFGDLLYLTVELFEKHPEVLDYYQNKFKYIMVDEYQDTNLIQFRMVNLLAKKHQNLCVVGDDDQSIYKFRGADIRNILEFEIHFPKAKVIKLEQNYRSTKIILEAANSVIKSNYSRKAKRLWTDNSIGEKISFYNLANEKQEADVIRDTIIQNERSGLFSYNEQSVLYRTNAQSRVIEEKLFAAGVPYKILGGLNFYQRKEIKDVLAYLRIINEDRDDVSLERIINYPTRGIGASTITALKNYAMDNGINLFDAVKNVKEIDTIKERAKKKVEEFYKLIEDMREELNTCDCLGDYVEELIDKIGLYKELLKDVHKGPEKFDNVNELLGKIREYSSADKDRTLADFLEEIALISDIDTYDEKSEYITLMTLHSAKGLEFPCVYMPGMEDGLFPSFMAINEGDEQIEEERRLCYVGITRAKKKLYILAVQSRFLNGNFSYNPISRFVEEIPSSLIEKKFTRQKAETYTARKKAVKNKPMPYSFSSRNNDTTPKKPIKKQNFKVGDFVKHRKFGVGEVLEVKDAGADIEIKVNFSAKGIKKLMPNLIGLEKLDI